MPKKSAPRRCWLLKSEPDAYSYDDLVRDGKTHWDGVRNYQARNLMRDEFHVGDLVLFYHSNAKPMAIVGLAKVVAEAYPDHTAFDSKSKYFDPKSDRDNPAWLMVDIAPVTAFDPPITRDELKAMPELDEMMLLRKGSRLSVQPVSDDELKAILKKAGVKAPR